MARRAIIIGAAGRDFHNFNVYFRNNPVYQVVAFTAAQIPYIENRTYPAELAGRQYPDGIPIYGEEKLEELIARYSADEVFFSYSDVSYENLMHLASRAIAAGASFSLLGPKDTQLESKKPVIAVLATRTGAGKSTIARMAVDSARKADLRPVIVRHPMPYGDLRVAVQHFKDYSDFKKYDITVEEEEEYADHIARGVDVFAGVDYGRILEQAEKLADVIIWDGGNNDFSFYRADCTIVVADPLRQGHESLYHPGEVNVRLADAVVINKVNVAAAEAVERTAESCRKLNPKAGIFRVASEVSVDLPELVRGKRVLVVEDGPSVTHGELREGAGVSAAKMLGCRLADPRPGAVGSIKKAYEKYPWAGHVMPALGYSAQQMKELEESINAADCDAVLLGTPADLRKRIRINRPAAKVTFEGRDAGEPRLTGYLDGIFASLR
ncbi:GTP-binding protein [Nitrososphaera sp.]|uniref:cyclic 2,3-diphosphoglycerate synthase n=1 Tax=Nitrososphaera sp. TaxID=1971748 RepID=UPI0017D1CC36|nr:GTP-binding protein [Nitrososphaera sp.]NWG37338.1 GTPase [Nitrososphaera sp.]